MADGQPSGLPEIVMNHATFRGGWDMPALAEACARAGLRRVSVWGDEIARAGAARSARVLADAGLGVFGYNRAGPLLAADRAQAEALFDAARREVEAAARLGADHILLFPGPMPAGARGLARARAETEEIAARLLEETRAAGIGLALEPLHPMLAGDRSPLCSLAEARALCDRLGPGAGLVVDSYHVWWDAALDGELAAAGPARLMGFHVNDWLVPTRDRLTDRGMMGDGIIDLAGLWAGMRRAGYDGPVEVEIFSDRWWAEPPAEVLELALARCREIFVAETAA